VLVNSLISIGNLSSLKKLHEDGADLNAVDYLGRSALHVVCAIGGNVKIAEYLIASKSCDINMKNNLGWSPLFVAILNKFEKVSELLIKQHGAKLIASDQRIAKMLCEIGSEGDVLRLRLLSQAGANLELSDYDNRTVGHLAAAEGHINVLKFLCESTKYNFLLLDRWNNTAENDLKT